MFFPTLSLNLLAQNSVALEGSHIPCSSAHPILDWQASTSPATMFWKVVRVLFPSISHPLHPRTDSMQGFFLLHLCPGQGICCHTLCGATLPGISCNPSLTLGSAVSPVLPWNLSPLPSDLARSPCIYITPFCRFSFTFPPFDQGISLESINSQSLGNSIGLSLKK